MTSDPKPFSWCFDRSPWDGRSDSLTFSIGIYQWIPKNSGKGVKRSSTIRVQGYVADPAAAYAKAEEVCRELNKQRVLAEKLPAWVQRQYSVPKPIEARRNTVRDQVATMAREVLGPKLNRLGFRRTGRKFWRDTPEVCHVVDVRMGRWGTSTSGYFHVNLGVFWHEIEEALQSPFCKKMPPPEYGCTFRIDLGMLTQARQNKSWNVDLNTDIEKLGRTVWTALRQHGLPWLEYRSELKTTLDSRRYSRPESTGEYSVHELVSYWASIVFMTKLGKVSEAKKELEQSIRKGCHAKIAQALAKRLDIEVLRAKSKR